MQPTDQMTLTMSNLLLIYGPLGLGWIGLGYLIHKMGAFISKLIELHTNRETEMAKREEIRDKLIREVMHEQAEAMKQLTHRILSMSKHMLYLTALSGNETLKQSANNELSRMDKG